MPKGMKLPVPLYWSIGNEKIIISISVMKTHIHIWDRKYLVRSYYITKGTWQSFYQTYCRMQNYIHISPECTAELYLYAWKIGHPSGPRPTSLGELGAMGCQTNLNNSYLEQFEKAEQSVLDIYCNLLAGCEISQLTGIDLLFLALIYNQYLFNCHKN